MLFDWPGSEMKSGSGSEITTRVIGQGEKKSVVIMRWQKGKKKFSMQITTYKE